MKKPKATKNQKGASLIELILYFGLFSIVLLIAVDFTLSTTEFGLEAFSRSTLQEDARFIGKRLSYDLRRATTIITPSNLGETSPLLVLQVGTETVTYRLNGERLEYEKVSGATTETAFVNSNLTKLNNISFQRLGNSTAKPTIKINFELENKKAAKSQDVKSFETVEKLR